METPPPAKSKGRRLIEVQLEAAGGHDLQALVHHHRNAKTSWPAIADHIRDLTGEKVNHETLRLWFKTEETAAKT